MNDENENSVKKTIANKCTWIRNHVSTFLSHVNEDLSVKILYLQQIFISFEKSTDFEGVIL